MVELFYIPEVILSIGVLFVIVTDLYLQKHKYISFFLIQFLLIIASLYAVTEVPQQNYSSYEFSEFISLIKFLLILGAIIIFQYIKILITIFFKLFEINIPNSFS